MIESACRISEGIRSAEVTDCAHLVMNRKLPGPEKFGTPSDEVCAIPPNAFSIQGPAWQANTPNLPCVAIIREKPSAAMTPSRYYRNTNGPIPYFTTASINGLAGKHAIHLTSSCFKIFAIASYPFIPSFF
jgi:hypothetical protein